MGFKEDFKSFIKEHYGKIITVIVAVIVAVALGLIFGVFKVHISTEEESSTKPTDPPGSGGLSNADADAETARLKEIEDEKARLKEIEDAKNPGSGSDITEPIEPTDPLQTDTIPTEPSIPVPNPTYPVITTSPATTAPATTSPATTAPTVPPSPLASDYIILTGSPKDQYPKRIQDILFLRKYFHTKKVKGTALTFDDNGTFTIHENGMYLISYNIVADDMQMAVSINSNKNLSERTLWTNSVSNSANASGPLFLKKGSTVNIMVWAPDTTKDWREMKGEHDLFTSIIKL